jgi:hypothetical protein
MTKFYSLISNNDGIAIVAVAMVLVVVALLGGAAISQTTHDAQLSNRAVFDKQAVFFAESAKERGYSEIKADEDFATAGNPGILNGVPIQGGSYDLSVYELSPVPNKVVQLVAVGNASNGTGRDLNVVAEVIRENVFVWNNAIFGGSGQAGGVISGNAAIHGSVHLLGGNVGAGNNSLAALDMTGASLIHNNYEGMPAELLAKLPALGTRNVNGEYVSTIDAKLRVKNGAVGISGNSELGEADVFGNAYKEKLDGIYIETNDTDTRWTGTAVTDGVPDDTQVLSDNGTEALYDLGDAVEMPDINNPITDQFGQVHANYGDYFAEYALILDIDLLVLDGNTTYADMVALQAGGALNGLQINPVGANGFEIYELAAGDPDSPPPVNPLLNPPAPNALVYNPKVVNGVAELRVVGMVLVEGDITLGQKNLAIQYSGDGTLYAAGQDGVVAGANMDDITDGAGNIEIHSDLLPVGIFPTSGVLGLIANADIGLATGAGDAQLMMAAAYFAGRQITSGKQNQIAGTFVCDFFNMGKNVPKIYQVPSLIDNLPPGMIGSTPIWIVTGFEEKSWQIELPPVATGGNPGEYGYHDPRIDIVLETKEEEMARLDEQPYDG